MIHYGMTKTAQLAVARGLAETLAGTAVTVNSVLPGPTSSEGVTTFVSDLAAAQNKDSAEVERDFFRTARPSVGDPALRDARGGGGHDRLPVQHGRLGDDRAALRVDGGVVRSIV